MADRTNDDEDQQPPEKRQKADDDETPTFPSLHWSLDPEGFFSDWTIHVVAVNDNKEEETVTYHVHRAVLVTAPFASGYFKTLFASNMAEQLNATSTMHFSEEQANCFPLILDIIYGKTQNPAAGTVFRKNMLNMIVLGDYLQLTDLDKGLNNGINGWPFSRAGLKMLLRFHQDSLNLTPEQLQYFDPMPSIVKEATDFAIHGLFDSVVDWKRFPRFPPTLITSVLQSIGDLSQPSHHMPRKVDLLVENWESFVKQILTIMEEQETDVQPKFFTETFDMDYLDDLKVFRQNYLKGPSIYVAHLNLECRFRSHASKELSESQLALIKLIRDDKYEYQRWGQAFRPFFVENVGANNLGVFQEACRYIPGHILSEFLWDDDVVEDASGGDDVVDDDLDEDDDGRIEVLLSSDEDEGDY